MLSLIEDTILSILIDGQGKRRNELGGLVQKHLGHAIQPASLLDEGIEYLKRQGHLDITGALIRRIEIDFTEATLEIPIGTFLRSEPAHTMLGLDKAKTCFQKTARDGAAGTGTWSRPDFTYATIRSYQFDPMKYLDVISIELKTAAGTDIPALHEALGQSRFAHFAYLICPRLTIKQAINDKLHHEATRLGVGLIQFDLYRDGPNQPRTENFEMRVAPQRKSPNPEMTDQFLDDRLNDDNKRTLLTLGGTRH